MEDIPDSLKRFPAGPVVNDGGLSWLRKNYQRMKEQAEREQRSLNDVVAERYGVRTDVTLAALTRAHAQFADAVTRKSHRTDEAIVWYSIYANGDWT